MDTNQPTAERIQRPKIVDPRLVGRCGMYCGHCHIHRAYKDSPTLRVKLAARFGCTPGEIRCDGCQAVHARGWSGDSSWGRNCRILECLGDRGLKSCHKCEAQPHCRGWAQLADSYEMLGVDLRANLQAIREQGVEAWLLQQDAQWRCIHCRAPVAVSEEVGVCLRCGKTPRY